METKTELEFYKQLTLNGVCRFAQSALIYDTFVFEQWWVYFYSYNITRKKEVLHLKDWIGQTTGSF